MKATINLKTWKTISSGHYIVFTFYELVKKCVVNIIADVDIGRLYVHM